MSKLQDKIIEEKYKNPLISIKELAKKVKCSNQTVRNALKKVKTTEVNFSCENCFGKDLNQKKSKEELKETQAKYLQALQKIEELQANLQAMQAFEQLNHVIAPANYEILAKEPGEATAITVASDWHIDEIVDGAAIGEVNNYNLEIARERIKKYFQYTLRLLNMSRTESKINTLVVAALGDFMSGWIHEELMSTNSLTPAEAIVELFELWCAGIQFLLEKGDLKKIVFVAVTGNHSRLTKKIQAKQNPTTSLEWPLYNFLARWFANSEYKDRIEFKLPKGYFNYLTVYNKIIRFHHGDGIRYAGGVGGIHIPLRKAIAQWNKAKYVNLDVLGHFHGRETSRDYVVNGSVVGFNEFAERIKADFEPPQQSFFIMHPKFGKTGEFPIILG